MFNFPGVGQRFVLAFSLKRNTIDLLKTDTAYDDINCLHGIRAVFSLIIYLIHRGVFGLFVPFINRTELAEVKLVASVFNFLNKINPETFIN
jgi:hypothetical protein